MPRDPAAAPSSGATSPRPVSPEPQALTVGLLSRLGTGMTVQATGLELHQDVEVNGARYRFTATQVNGTLFKGRLVGASGEKWSDKFDLARFPGALELARTVLGAEAVATPAPAQTPPARKEAAAPRAPSTPVPSHLAPRVGETWVMNVLVENDDGREIRYVCTDVDGRSYGAARVLARNDFEEVFCHERGGWRLRIGIEAISEDRVSYRQLDRHGRPRGGSKALATAVLVTTFVPEAAAY